MESYTAQESLLESIDYFDGDRLPADAWLRKYCLKDRTKYLEATPDDTHWRMAREFARMETKLSPTDPVPSNVFYEAMKNFARIVPQGSPMYAIGNQYSLASVSNCFVVPGPTDSIESIFNSARDMSQIMKRRGGVGVDLSKLRPEDAPVNNSANRSSGAWSFSDFYSYCGRMIGQNGRQGAIMITMHIKHPDARQFALMKSDRTKVTGANVSLKITDEFMRAVENDEDFVQQWPVDSDNPEFVQTINARELWDVIVDCAQQSGEPGLLMWDNICDNLPAHCFSGFEAVCVNPCAELVLSPYDSCRLISMNLTGYVNAPFNGSSFNWDLFKKDVRLAMRMSDNLVELEIEAVQRIMSGLDSSSDEFQMWCKVEETAEWGRRTGLGTHGLADCLAMLGVRYDSEEALRMVDEIYGTLKETAYDESVEMAKERGPFPVWGPGVDDQCAFIQRMSPDLQSKMQVHGRRNISLLTNAPTGTISCLSQTSSGIEPIFRLQYDRRVKLTWDDVPLSVDFVDEKGDKWHQYSVKHHAFQAWLDHEGISEENGYKIPDFFITSDQINPDMRVQIQSAIQSHIDHGVSSTLNLPAGSTMDDVHNIYFQAWKMGLKGVTVYVDGSRTGVLITDEEKKRPRKRPLELDCTIHRTSYRGEDWLVIVSFFQNSPYEVFAGKAEDLVIPKSLTEAKVRKLRSRTYGMIYPVAVNGHSTEAIIPIKESFTEASGMLVRLLMNISLRHEVPLGSLYETVVKSTDITTFARVVMRVLKQYINLDDTNSGIRCLICKGPVIREEGCFKCSSCGHAGCD